MKHRRLSINFVILLVVSPISTQLISEKSFYLLGTMAGQGANSYYYHAVEIGASCDNE